jgi:5,5'-dehydrodivanillate O-demethylase
MATSQEQSERLTRVGPGTPMGELLRRYWQVAGTVLELEQEPVQRIRLLGENLTLFRTERGEYGLVDEVCPHRCMAMEYGIPQENGLRCAYHGWLFAPSGQCLEQPFEETVNPQARFKDKVRIKAYPVQELGGLIWAYMGPQPAPLLPRWDVLVREDTDRVIDMHPLPCNWLQCMDNSLDPVHFEHLHAVFGNYQLKKLGRPPAMFPAKHVKIAFDKFEYGIYKRRLLEGEPETIDDWQIGHPILFPNTLAVGEEHKPVLQIRVPVDDTNTLHIQYRTSRREPGAKPKPIVVHRDDLFMKGERVIADNIPKQDMVAWVAQGPVSERTKEHLGASDVGVIMYHKMLLEEADKVARGEDPLGVIRDPAVNEPMIRIRRERVGYQAFRSNYGQVDDTIRELVAAGSR